MIYVVIGASCSGKSSLVRNTIKDSKVSYFKDLVLVGETDKYFVIGNYDTDKRRVGTDTLERKCIKVIGQQVSRLVGKGKDIILEGTRCCTHNTMTELAKYDTTMIYLDCSLEKSISRNEALGFTSTVKSLKHDVTMCRNFYDKYKDEMKAIRIDSDSITDFSKICLNDFTLTKL